MRYDKLAEQTNKLNAEMKRKREAENTILDGFDSKLSGLEFTVGESDTSIKYLFPLMGITAVIVLRILLKDSIRGGSGFGTIGIICIVLLAIIIAGSTVFQKNKSKITVREKTCK